MTPTPTRTPNLKLNLDANLKVVSLNSETGFVYVDYVNIVIYVSLYLILSGVAYFIARVGLYPGLP